MQRMGGIVLFLALAAWPSSSARGVPEADAPGEVVTVERAHWPILVHAAGGRREAADRCARIGASDVTVARDGEPLVVTAVGPRPLPRTHALLVDTSHSMVPRLDDARQAAREYVEALPQQDRIVIASFDENLVLGTAATNDRDAARRAIDALETGYYTALWDALYYLVRYVETLHGEKIIVLISDGEDSSSTRAHRYDRVIEMAAGTPNLTVFPVGIRLSPRVALGTTTRGSIARGQLGRLAAATGGELFEIQSVDQLAEVLRRTRERLDARVYVSFIPPADDARPLVANRRQRLRVTLRDGIPCRVVPLGSAGRFEPRSPGATADLTVDSVPAPRSMSDSGCLPAPAARQATALRVDVGDETPTVPALYALETGEFLLGRVQDLIAEAGPLFRAAAYVERGRLRMTANGQPKFAEREVAVLTPPLALVRSEITAPHHVLRFLLEQDLCAPLPSADPGAPRAPFLVHGQTMLELRELVGRVLFRERPDYRDWARQQVRRQVRRDIDTLDRRLPEDERLDAQRRAGLERELTRQATSPIEGRPHTGLAEWLGDADARDAALTLEVWLANRLLDLELDGGEIARAVAARDAWFKLGRWFGPAIQGRITAALVPAFDPTREVVGFYRFLLPRPRMLERRPPLIPSRPRGLELILELVQRSDAKEWLAGSPRVLAIEHESLRTRRQRRCSGRRDAHERVELRLASGKATTGDTRLEAYFVEAGGSPACVAVIAERGPASPMASELASLLGISVSAAE